MPSLRVEREVLPSGTLELASPKDEGEGHAVGEHREGHLARPQVVGVGVAGEVVHLELRCPVCLGFVPEDGPLSLVEGPLECRSDRMVSLHVGQPQCSEVLLPDL